MLSKKTIKIISIIALAMMLVLTMSSLVFASSGGASGGVYTVPSGTTSKFSEKASSAGGIILGAFQAVGTAVAIVILVWLGVKYVMASPDGKAEIKKQAFGYILGAVLIFGAPWIITLVMNLATELGN